MKRTKKTRKPLRARPEESSSSIPFGGNPGSAESRELALSLLGSEPYLTIHKSLLREEGPIMAVYVGNLIDKYRYFAKRDKLDQHGGFFLTHEAQKEQLGISDYHLRQCKKALIEMGVLETFMKGIPAKERYYLNFDKLLDMHRRASPTKSGRSSPNDFGRAYIKENKVKENKKEKELFAKTQDQSPKARKIVDLYHKHCPSFPKVMKVTPSRRKAINARLKDFPIVTIKKVFQKAEASNFLSGRSGDWNNCNFDWLLNENNLVKVLEGKYDNDPTASPTREDVDPYELIETELGPDLGRSFSSGCYAPAEELLPSPNPGELARTLLRLLDEIEDAQDHFTAEMYRITPEYGPMTLLEAYVDWLHEQNRTWLKDPKLNLFDITHTLFQRFCREYSDVDAKGRHPLTGEPPRAR